MKSKTIFQIALLVLVVGGGIYYLSNWMKPGPISIVCDIHAPRINRWNKNNPNRPRFEVAFGFDNRYKLTDLEIVPLTEWTTNKEAAPLWHLTSESNSVPVKAVIYGRGIRGMHPAIAKMRAEELQTNVTYRLLVTAGSRAGHCDFKMPVLPVR